MSTSSAPKGMIINTRERAVSSDINRLQAFLAAGAAEAARSLFLGLVSEVQSGGVATLPSSIETPLAAMFVSGGLCRPQMASLNVFVDPSVCWVVNPDAAPSTDDSACKLVVDPGNTTPGALVMTVGAVGTRVDVLEARPKLFITETSNRDIYSPSTGLFSPATVNKVQELRWEFRIRTGTAGAGYPGNSAGWLPLMVFAVPSTATTWNDVLWIWDVRPLYADFIAPAKHTYPQVRPRIAELNFQGTGTATPQILKGRVESSFGHHIAGGVLPVGGINVSGNDYGESGWLAASTDKVWYLYAAFPFGLPRWAQYSAVAAGFRLPMAFRGIPIATQKRPLVEGTLSTSVGFPTNTGLTGTTSSAVALMAGAGDGGGSTFSSMVHGGITYTSQTAQITGAGGSACALTLDDAAIPAVVPIGAKAVLLEHEWIFNADASDSSANIKIVPSLDGVTLPGRSFYFYDAAFPANTSIFHEWEIPMRPIYPDLTTLSRVITFTSTGMLVGAGFGVVDPGKFRIKGWRF